MKKCPICNFEKHDARAAWGDPIPVHIKRFFHKQMLCQTCRYKLEVFLFDGWRGGWQGLKYGSQNYEHLKIMMLDWILKQLFSSRGWNYNHKKAYDSSRNMKIREQMKKAVELLVKNSSKDLKKFRIDSIPRTR